MKVFKMLDLRQWIRNRCFKIIFLLKFFFISILLILSFLTELFAVDSPTESELIVPQPKSISILDIQPDKEQTSYLIAENGAPTGKVSLINLNPSVNSWYLLKIQWYHNNSEQIFHLENIFPDLQNLTLQEKNPWHLVIITKKQHYLCKLWSNTAAIELEEAMGSGKTFAPLCNDSIYLRNKTDGYKTTLEWGVDFVRDYFPGGDRITTLVKNILYKDAYKEIPEETVQADPGTGKHLPEPAGAPASPLLNPEFTDIYLKPSGLGLDLLLSKEERLLVGHWYQVKDQPGVYISILQPNMIAETFIKEPSRLKPVDDIEQTALVYMIAFDIEKFSLRFSLGTDHPRVNWSDRALDQVRDSSLPGPDGFDSSFPLIRTGQISPMAALTIAAAFTGGFKRVHGAFHWGDLALKNRGSHYGFLEEGVQFSRLQPGLSTIIVTNSGFVDLKTWQTSDNIQLPHIRYARQNGVPLVATDEKSGRSEPGALVPFWGAGNWSGSAEGLLRSLRAGLAVHENGGKRFILYGYFSTATPSTMARVFQAYQVKYAMLMDMNALEHTYLALYKQERKQISVQHLIKGMSVLDKKTKGITIPRFIGYADNRDFFYLLRKTNR